MKIVVKQKLLCCITTFFIVVSLKAQTQKPPADMASPAHVAALKAASYEFADTSGKVHRLSEFEGKYVYLDIWASWCNPCRKEYPFLKKLSETVNPDKVQVVSISIDSQRWRWIGGMIGYGMSHGVQWLATDTLFSKDFDVDRIPRFILFDKKGKVMNYTMTRPSDEKTIALLNDLK